MALFGGDDYMGSEFEEEGQYAEPTLDELVVDDTLNAVDMFKKYILSDIVLHRLYVVRSLGDSVREMGFDETLKVVIPCMEDILRDEESIIRQSLAQNLDGMAAFFIEKGETAGKQQVVHAILPVLAELMTDESAPVRASALESLVSLAPRFDKDVHVNHLFPLLEALAEDNTGEEHRVEATELFARLAVVFGKELCTTRVLPLMIHLASDHMFRVRRAVAGSLGGLCPVLGVELVESQVLPVFDSLCKDDIWGVRKAAAEHFVSVAAHVTAEVRGDIIMSWFHRFTRDVSRWVRAAAFQYLGALVVTFAKDEGGPPQALIRRFVGMTRGGAEADHGEVLSYCAYNFPAVVVTLGAAQWDDLSQAFHVLAENLQWKVRKTMAHSIHEIAHVLGPEMTEKELLPVFDTFLQDLPEIQIGVVMHMAEFLRVVPVPARAKYLESIVQIYHSAGRNWRMRKYLAQQWSEFCVLFPKDAFCSTLIGVTEELLCDQVARVRYLMLSSIPALLDLIEEEKGEIEEVWSGFMENVWIKSSAHNCHDRMVFVRIACAVSGVDHFVGIHFVDRLRAMMDDPVSNVRLLLAKGLHSTMCENDRWSDVAQEMIEKLKEDSNDDVRFCASGDVWYDPNEDKEWEDESK